MPPKPAKPAKPPTVNLKAMMDKKNKNEKPKRPPPPPKCFTEEDLQRFKELFKLFDEEEVERIPLHLIPQMLRKLGFNPKGYEIKKLCETVLEDEFVDTIELYHWYRMIELKKFWGDNIEYEVTNAFQFILHDEHETGIGDIETLEAELMQWGEPLSELEFKDFPKAALKEKSLDEHGKFSYLKFVDRMNAKDIKFNPEPINFFKLDQKTLAAMALAKRNEELAEQAKKETERKAREEYKLKKMIEAGLIQTDA